MSELLHASATQLAARLRSGELDPVEVVEVHIQRIEAVNAALNAVVADRFEAARAEAHAARQRLTQPHPPPLLGVPCTIKEFVGVKEMPNTGGILVRAHERATNDATVVRRLRKAGAIVLGVTNAPEGGLWHETNNPVYGRTSNPWDLHRTPGGSSGGEGAILAAGGAPFGVGSDVGGSIRIPAAFCGVAGHKPSGRLVPNTGHFPQAPTGPRAPMSIGPMARHAEDLWPLLKIMAGPDGVDPICAPFELGDPAAVDWREVRVIPLPTNGQARPSAPMRAAVHKATAALVERGATVHHVDIPELRQAFEVWAAVLSESGDSYDDLLSNGEGISKLKELLRYPLGRAHHAGGVLALLIIEGLIHGDPERIHHMAQLADRIHERLHEELGPKGVLIHPPFTRTAPRHRAMALRMPWDVGLTTLFNITELPVSVVSIDTCPRGLPVAVQIAAQRGNDHLTIAAAVALEDDFGGWRRPVTPRWGPRAPLGLRLIR